MFLYAHLYLLWHSHKSKVFTVNHKNLIIFCIHIYQEKLQPIKKLSNHRYFLQMLSLVLLRQEEEEGTKIGY